MSQGPDAPRECPHCGGAAELREAGSQGRQHWVECTTPDCHAMGPNRGTPRDAALGWNRRSPVPGGEALDTLWTDLLEAAALAEATAHKIGRTPEYAKAAGNAFALGTRLRQHARGVRDSLLAAAPIPAEPQCDGSCAEDFGPMAPCVPPCPAAKPRAPIPAEQREAGDTPAKALNRFTLFALLHQADKSLSQRGDEIWDAIESDRASRAVPGTESTETREAVGNGPGECRPALDGMCLGCGRQHYSAVPVEFAKRLGEIDRQIKAQKPPHPYPSGPGQRRRVELMVCTVTGCRAKFRGKNPIWEAEDTRRMIAAGWRVYQFQGLGDPSLKDGEALCPAHAAQPPLPGKERG